jgi:hypothetical protein
VSARTTDDIEEMANTKEKGREQEMERTIEKYDCSSDADHLLSNTFDFNMKKNVNLFNKYKGRVNRDNRKVYMMEQMHLYEQMCNSNEIDELSIIKRNNNDGNTL